MRFCFLSKWTQCKAYWVYRTGGALYKCLIKFYLIFWFKNWYRFIEMKSSKLTSAYAVVKTTLLTELKIPILNIFSVNMCIVAPLSVIECYLLSVLSHGWTNPYLTACMLWRCLTCSPEHPWRPVWSRRVVGGAPEIHTPHHPPSCSRHHRTPPSGSWDTHTTITNLVTHFTITLLQNSDSFKYLWHFFNYNFELVYI